MSLFHQKGAGSSLIWIKRSVATLPKNMTASQELVLIRINQLISPAPDRLEGRLTKKACGDSHAATKRTPWNLIWKCLALYGHNLLIGRVAVRSLGREDVLMRVWNQVYVVVVLEGLLIKVWVVDAWLGWACRNLCGCFGYVLFGKAAVFLHKISVVWLYFETGLRYF